MRNNKSTRNSSKFNANSYEVKERRAIRMALAISLIVIVVTCLMVQALRYFRTLKDKLNILKKWVRDGGNPFKSKSHRDSFKGWRSHENAKQVMKVNITRKGRTYQFTMDIDCSVRKCVNMHLHEENAEYGWYTVKVDDKKPFRIKYSSK